MEVMVDSLAIEFPVGSPLGIGDRPPAIARILTTNLLDESVHVQPVEDSR